MNISNLKKKSINPAMDFISMSDYSAYMEYCIKILGQSHNVLDIGGGRGRNFDIGQANYYVMDLNAHNDKRFILGDITDQNLDIDKKFDLILTKDTFEHILNPWDATSNILNLLNEGGKFFCTVPFSWRFHPSPYDAYRYSHQGLKYLFERLGKMEEIDSGYIYHSKRISGKWKNKLDNWPPNNVFYDNVSSYYIGRKNSEKKFNISEIKGDFSLNHDTVKLTND